MKTARLQCGWKGSGTYTDPYRPAVVDDYALHSWTDVTGAPPGTPCTLDLACADAVHAVLIADPKYTVLVADEV